MLLKVFSYSSGWEQNNLSLLSLIFCKINRELMEIGEKLYFQVLLMRCFIDIYILTYVTFKLFVTFSLLSIKKVLHLPQKILQKPCVTDLCGYCIFWLRVFDV